MGSSSKKLPVLGFAFKAGATKFVGGAIGLKAVGGRLGLGGFIKEDET